MANANSIEVQSAERAAFAQFDDAFVRVKNLVTAVARLAGAHLDTSEDELNENALYYAHELHGNTSAIVGLADMLDKVMEKEIWAAVVALSSAVPEADTAEASHG